VRWDGLGWEGVFFPLKKKLFLLSQANGWACVDFGCIYPIDGLF